MTFSPQSESNEGFGQQKNLVLSKLTGLDNVLRVVQAIQNIFNHYDNTDVYFSEKLQIQQKAGP